MNGAHAHLILNHVPVIGTALGFGLLLIAVLRRSQELIKAGLVAFILMALLAIPAYLTGEPAEDVVEHLPGVSKPAIEPHEEAAGAALAGVVLLGLFSFVVLGISWRRPAVPRGLAVAALALGLAVSALMAYTANLGGHIRHPEIGSTPPAASEAEDD